MPGGDGDPAATKRLAPSAYCPALLLLALPLLAGGGGAGLPTAGPAPDHTKPKARNPNLGNGIPDIRILAYRTRSAFGFGIPPYDLLIPREIQKTDGYDQVATK